MRYPMFIWNPGRRTYWFNWTQWAGKLPFQPLIRTCMNQVKDLIQLNVDGKMMEIGGKKPYVITRMGLARTFQNIRLFKTQSVCTNVKIAMHKNIKYGTFQAIFRTPAFYKEEERVQKEAEELLKVVGLYEKRDELASNLPYGEQRKLEIARACYQS